LILQFLKRDKENEQEVEGKTRSQETEVDKQFCNMPSVVIAHVHRRYVDLNRSPSKAYESKIARRYYEAYHTEVQRLISRALIQSPYALLIDLHGQSDDKRGLLWRTRAPKQSSPLLFKGTLDQWALTSQEALLGQDSVLNFFQQLNYSLTSLEADQELNSRYGGFAIDYYSSQILTIQLETGYYFRDTEEHRSHFSADAVIVLLNYYQQFIVKQCCT